MDSKFSLPTEVVELPSKGLLYPEDSPLSKGTVEMKYMTAKEEDILTNQNFIKNGTVINKLLQSLIVTPVSYNDLLIGDKNAILIGNLAHNIHPIAGQGLNLSIKDIVSEIKKNKDISRKEIYNYF